ncbi:MAG: SDR family NAD(P)-dependent oxidoreductase [Gammaproteobacteria bacterium]|nr:MAG: SDR family NAD(P)-dependent oxidoreductase [Gammaproteobacteria bacterium]
MTTSYDIKGKTALVTGANRGIGKVIVETLIDKGGVKKVYAAVRNLDSAKPLIDQYGDQVEVILIDLEKPETIKQAATKATDVDIIVNNAGVLKTSTPLDANALDSMAYEMDMNVSGLVRMAQAFAPVLKKNGGGALIQLNSLASIKSFAPFATYSASKAAAYSITQALRDLLKEQGTTVVSVHPGPIATEMADAAGIGEIAEPPSLVADSILEALEKGEFHAFPDSMAKQFEGEYQGFAENIVNANLLG